MRYLYSIFTVDVIKDLRKAISYFVVALVTILIIKCALNFGVIKKDICTATIVDIRYCTDIGDVLSQRIYDYVQNNNIHNVQALDGKIKGLGNKRLYELMEVYR